LARDRGGERERAVQSGSQLLIGNQGYDPAVGILWNPHKDIALVG
jgi:hypothetical protein